MREHEMPARGSASLVSSAARGVADGNLLGSAHELVIVDTLNALTCTDAAISRGQTGASIEMGNGCARGLPRSSTDGHREGGAAEIIEGAIGNGTRNNGSCGRHVETFHK